MAKWRKEHHITVEALTKLVEKWRQEIKIIQRDLECYMDLRSRYELTERLRVLKRCTKGLERLFYKEH